jgi:excisionase family DNA binding protein
MINRFTAIRDLPELLRVTETAAVLDVSTDFVYDLMKRGKLPYVRLGRLIRVPRTALEAMQEKERGAA